MPSIFPPRDVGVINRFAHRFGGLISPWVGEGLLSAMWWVMPESAGASQHGAAGGREPPSPARDRRKRTPRLLRLSFLAPDITQAILEGRQPPDLTADKLLAHSRLPLVWHEQRTVLGFA